MAYKTFNRRIEGIVPKTDRKTFYLPEAEDTQFNMAAAPPVQQQGMEQPPMEEQPVQDETPEAGTDTETEGRETPDAASWPIKKLVGLLRYAGAMSTQVRGAIPQEAFEVITKIENDLEEILEQLKPYVNLEDIDSEDPELEPDKEDYEAIDAEEAPEPNEEI